MLWPLLIVGETKSTKSYVFSLTDLDLYVCLKIVKNGAWYTIVSVDE